MFVISLLTNGIRLISPTVVFTVGFKASIMYSERLEFNIPNNKKGDKSFLGNIDLAPVSKILPVGKYLKLVPFEPAPVNVIPSLK